MERPFQNLDVGPELGHLRIEPRTAPSGRLQKRERGMRRAELLETRLYHVGQQRGGQERQQATSDHGQLSTIQLLQEVVHIQFPMSLFNTIASSKSTTLVWA